jgi:hypothetical protein
MFWKRQEAMELSLDFGSANLGGSYVTSSDKDRLLADASPLVSMTAWIPE